MHYLYYSFSLIALLTCAASMKIIIQRLNVCDSKHHLKDRIKYTAILTMLMIAALQPYYAKTFPNAGLLLLSICVLILLYDGAMSYVKYKDKEEFCDTNLGHFDDIDLEDKHENI